MTIVMPDIVALAGNDMQVLVQSDNTGANHYLYIDVLDAQDNKIATLRRKADAERKARFGIGKILMSHYLQAFQVGYDVVVRNDVLSMQYKIRAYESIDFGNFQNYTTSDIQIAVMGGMWQPVIDWWKMQNKSFYSEYIQAKRFLTWKPNPYSIPRKRTFEKLFFLNMEATEGELTIDGSPVWSGSLEWGKIYELEISENIQDGSQVQFTGSEIREYKEMDAQTIEFVFRNSFGVYDTLHLIVSEYERDRFSYSNQGDGNFLKYNSAWQKSYELAMIVERHDRAMLRYLSDFFRSPEVYMIAGVMLPVRIEIEERKIYDNRLNMIVFTVSTESDSFFSEVILEDIDVIDTHYLLASPTTIILSNENTKLIWKK